MPGLSRLSTVYRYGLFLLMMEWLHNILSEMMNAMNEGVTVNKNSYVYPSVLTQQADEGSILNYYKNAMWIRHRNPEIARGTIEKLPISDRYVSAFAKTWKDSRIVILINLSDIEEKAVDVSSYGKLELKDSLVVSGKVSKNNNAVTLPPYSIAILK